MTGKENQTFAEKVKEALRRARLKAQLKRAEITNDQYTQRLNQGLNPSKPLNIIEENPKSDNT